MSIDTESNTQSGEITNEAVAVKIVGQSKHLVTEEASFFTLF